jgi:hypothetical protein
VNVCRCLCLCLWGHFSQCAPPVAVEVSDVLCGRVSAFVSFVRAMFRSRVEPRVEAWGSRDFFGCKFHSRPLLPPIRSLLPPSRSLLLWGQDIVWLQLFSSPPRLDLSSPLLSLPPPLLLSPSLSPFLSFSRSLSPHAFTARAFDLMTACRRTKRRRKRRWRRRRPVGVWATRIFKGKTLRVVARESLEPRVYIF